MLEAIIERHLRQRVEEMGGVCWKWTSPSMGGVPDRICLLPNGRVLFVELKAPGELPTRLQLAVQKQIERLGFDVHTVDSKEACDALLR